MKNYYVDLTPKAQRDISSILNYIAIDLCAPSASLNLNAKILEQIERLETFPLCGEVYISEIPLKREYRRLVVDNYLIFYTVNEATETVTIMNVVYGASNYLSIL